MPTYPEIVKSYLNRCNANPWKLEWNVKKGISNVIVIPAIAEFENIEILLTSLLKNNSDNFDSTLIIFVINNARTHSNEIKQSNKKTVYLLRSIIRKNKTGEQVVTNILESGLNIALIDASSDGNELPAKDGGVGFARKIGLDFALTVFDYSIEGKKILIWLDADCTVSKNYINSIIQEFNNRDIFAATINFEHNISDNTEFTEAIIPYEIFLRYYVLGLKFARSPYAFHTIGSSIVIDHNAYTKAGGMNKKKAAEDFYFLQKVSKNFEVKTITGTAVYPSSRHSWRVPFGTGRSVTRFLQSRKNEYLLINPIAFEVLKKWLALFEIHDIIDNNDLIKQAGEINIELKNFLMQKKFFEQWRNILKNSKSTEQLQYQKRVWFDGFKTLKLIHHLRDHSYHSVNMFDAVDKLLIKSGEDIIERKTKNVIPSLDIQREYLLRLREIESK